MSAALKEKDESAYAHDSDGQEAGSQPDKDNFQEGEHLGKATDRRLSLEEGQVRHKKLGWQRLTVRRCSMPPTSPAPFVLPALAVNKHLLTLQRPYPDLPHCRSHCFRLPQHAQRLRQLRNGRRRHHDRGPRSHRHLYQLCRRPSQAQASPC